MVDPSQPTRSAWNRFLGEVEIPPFSSEHLDEIRDFHRSLPGYCPTPLVDLPGLAGRLGVGRILVKDESRRFGLNAFKVLGASYGMFRLLRDRAGRSESSPSETLTFATATDGNHGRAVAWAASRLGHRAVVFVSEDMAGARCQAIAGEGAELRVVAGNYDEAVAEADRVSRREDWLILSDTGYPGYLEIPAWVTAGYATLFGEIQEELARRSLASPTHVFLQGGVGGMASSGVRAMKSWLPRPRFVCVEPLEAACLLESIESPDGSPRTAGGSIRSIMSGLNCAIPSLQAWPVLRSEIDLFLAVADHWAESSLRQLYFPVGTDPRIVAGETGGAGLAGLMALLAEPRPEGPAEALGIGRDSTILLINTEGDTDPVGFQRILARGRPAT